MSRQYSEEVKQEIEAARKVIEIWLEKPERLQIVRSIADIVTSSVSSPDYTGMGLSLQLDHDSLVILGKAMHMLQGLLMTAERMADPAEPPANRN